MKTFYILLVLTLVSCSKNDHNEQDIKLVQQTKLVQEPSTPDLISGNWYVKSYDAGPWSGPIENFNPSDIVISFSENSVVNVSFDTVLPANSRFIYNQNTTANYTITQPNNKIMLSGKRYFIVPDSSDSNNLYLDGNTIVDGDLIILKKI